MVRTVRIYLYTILTLSCRQNKNRKNNIYPQVNHKLPF